MAFSINIPLGEKKRTHFFLLYAYQLSVPVAIKFSVCSDRDSWIEREKKRWWLMAYTTICNSIWYAGANKTKSNLISCRFSFDAFYQQVAIGNSKFMYAYFIFTVIFGLLFAVSTSKVTFSRSFAWYIEQNWIKLTRPKSYWVVSSVSIKNENEKLNGYF